MSRSGREALADVREWSGGMPDVKEWSGGPPGFPKVVGRTFRMFESGGKPIQISRSGREVLSDIPKWSGGHSEW